MKVFVFILISLVAVCSFANDPLKEIRLLACEGVQDEIETLKAGMIHWVGPCRDAYRQSIEIILKKTQEVNSCEAMKLEYLKRDTQVQSYFIENLCQD